MDTISYPTNGGLNLSLGYSREQLNDALHRLIETHLTTLGKRGNLYILTELQYVRGENSEELSYMHFVARAKEVGVRNESETLHLTLAVSRSGI